MSQNAVKYVGAPYNFVPIAEKIYKRYQREGDLPKHNIIDKERYSGELQCQVRALTDIFIGGGEEIEGYSTFSHDIDGLPCIPGSSMKGLVRSNMQVLGFGSIAGDVEDYNIMYRQVGAAKSKVARYYSENILDVKTVPLGKDKNGKMQQTTVPKNVKAGYISKINGEYRIYRTEVNAIKRDTFGECNYYPVYEPLVMHANEVAESRGKQLPFSFYGKNGIELQHIGKSSDFKREEDRGRVHVKGRENRTYIPYFTPVYYKLKDQRHVEAVLSQEVTCPAGFKEGFVISTGKMQEKKTFYVIPKKKEDDCIKIPETDVLSFKQDYENKKNKLHGVLKDDTMKEKCRKFFALPEEGECKPVFYVERGGRLYFGYTPFLRIFYEHSIMRGVSIEQRKYMKENGDLKMPVLDYPSAILGYATDKSSYKSRVSFEDFHLCLPEGIDLEQYLKGQQYRVTLVQGEPKLSSYFDYLVQNNEECAMTYNEDDFELRGIKQYWLHETVHRGNEVKNENAASHFTPLKKGATFIGKVRFKNLSADELGLLIWSLSLETDSNQNIGHAKSFGYGRIELTLENFRLYNFDKMYHGSILNMDIFEEKGAEEINGFIRQYKEYMNQNYSKQKDIMKEKGVSALLKMKDKHNIPEEDSIQYMSFDNRDYQNRTLPLHTIDQVLDHEKPRAISERTGRGRQNSSGSYNSNQRQNSVRRTSNAGRNAYGVHAQSRSNHRGGEIEIGIVQPYKKTAVIKFKIADKKAESVPCSKLGISVEEAQKKYPPGSEIKVRFKGVTGTGFREYEIVE